MSAEQKPYVERADRLSALANRLRREGCISKEEQYELFYLAESVWDDALHFAAPWDERASLCGNWGRNLIPLDDLGDVRLERCWTCLGIRDWMRDNVRSPPKPGDPS